MSLIPDVIPTWVKVAVVALILSAAFAWTSHTSYKYGFNERDVQAKADTIKQRDADLDAQKKIMADKAALQLKYDGLSDELATTKLQLDQAKSDVKIKVVKEIQSNPVYQSCIMPPSGLQIIIDQATKLNAIRSGSTKN